MDNISEIQYNLAGIVRDDNKRMILNGKWEFEFDREDVGISENWQELENFSKEINVPYVFESKLSGICDTAASVRVWYSRKFVLPSSFDTDKGKVILHIDAMDYEGSVWINSIYIGKHIGGYVPAVFDITDSLLTGDNRIVVSCFDDTSNPLQPSGKQAEVPKGCFYTKCTGIWQSVWIEYVPKSYVKNVLITPSLDDNSISVDIDKVGNGEVTYEVFFDNELISSKVSNDKVTVINIENPILWDIEKGNLYDLKISYGEDVVYTYFGMREIKVKGNKLYLNNKELFMRLVLDQGYYPDGIYTSGSPDDFYRDIDLCLAAGFNGSRMHMKVFEPGFIRAADKKGYILWGEYPNWGIDISKVEANKIVLDEWMAEVNRDYNHPSIIGWCPFNEAWSGSNSIIVEVCDWTMSFDHSRLVIDDSGYVHDKIYDIYDVHDYCQDVDEFYKHYSPLESGEGNVFMNNCEKVSYDGKKPYFISEFGGAFYSIDDNSNYGHDSGNSWGYGEAPKGEVAFIERLNGLCSVLRENTGVCGFCYTQFTDVMQEMNGIFTYDRRPKFNMKSVYKSISGK